MLDGHFARGGEPEAFAAVGQVAAALGVSRRVTIPEAHRARAAAMVITASEGANVHLADLKRRPQDFDPLTRDRFLAGALVPAAVYVQAQRFRAWYRARVAELFAEVDVLLAPTTPCPAPPIGQERVLLDGVEVLVRPNLGVYTQPLSFIGLPVLSVPVVRPRRAAAGRSARGRALPGGRRAPGRRAARGEGRGGGRGDGLIVAPSTCADARESHFFLPRIEARDYAVSNPAGVPRGRSR